jgi:ABC-2 type transport system permease protein
MMDLQQLWKHRKDAFWQEVFPYFRYVGQSGFLVLLAFLIIGGAAGYAGFLDRIPENYPIRIVSLVVLTPFVIYSSIRTFLKSADIVYLLRVEPRMQEYFRRSFRYSIVPQAIFLSVAYCILWLLYVRADPDPKSFLLLWAVLLILKVCNSYGSWQERRMSMPFARWAYRFVRFALSILLIAVWLWQPTWKAFLFSVILILTYGIALRFPPKHKVPWDTLIALERDQRGRFMIFLNWFVDVPSMPQKVYKRTWLNALSKKMPWQQQSAYFYLYTKTLLRSDVLGMVMRLLAIGMLIMYWLRDSSWAVLVYAFILFVLGTQLTAIRRFHRYSFWASIYPIPFRSRKQAIVKLARRVHLITAVLLWLPLVLGAGAWSIRIVLLLGGVLFVYLFQWIWSRKKWMEHEDDED